MTDLNDEIYFKRFDDKKQEQIRQLVSYCTLLGLSPDDLVSIGNRLKRFKTSSEAKHNKTLIKDLYNDVFVRRYSYWDLKFDFSYKKEIYHCEYHHYKTYITIRNKRTEIVKTCDVKLYNVGTGIKGLIGVFLLNIKNGDIVIDF